jgi:hypothetical protein
MLPRSFRLGRSRLRTGVGLVVPVLAIALLIGGCDVDNPNVVPSPADFGGLANELLKRGIGIDHAVSGDAGCTDATLTPTAIGFDARGLDQPTVVRIHLYAFKDHATFDRLRSSVDACARAFVTDPSTYEAVDASPFVVTGQGPWGPQFEAAMRAGLTAAAAPGSSSAPSGPSSAVPSPSSSAPGPSSSVSGTTSPSP